MTKKLSSWKIVWFLFVFVVLGIFVKQAIASFSNPACPPPGCNTEGPIDVSGSVQTKAGGLGVVGATAFSTWGSSPATIGDQGGSVTNTDGKFRVFGNMSIWGGDLSSKKYLEVSYVGNGPTLNPALNVRNGPSTQGNLSILPKTSALEGGSVLLKSDSLSGNVSIGKNGLVNLDVQGNVNVGQLVVPSSYFYTKGGEVVSTTTIDAHATPVESSWPSAWRISGAVSLRISCDGLLNESEEECPSNSYSANPGSPMKAYNLYIKTSQLPAQSCPPPPNGNDLCKYNLAAREFTRNTVPSTFQGGALNALEGQFRDSVSSPYYCPKNSTGSNCLSVLDSGAVYTPSDLNVNGEIVQNGQTGALTFPILSGKRMGLYSHLASPPLTPDLFGLEVKTYSAYAYLPTSWLWASVSNGNWGFNTLPTDTSTLSVGGDVTSYGDINASGRFCLRGSCINSWPSAPTSTMGSGTDGRLVLWSGTSSLIASRVIESGSLLNIPHRDVLLNSGLLINANDDANIRDLAATTSSLGTGAIRFGAGDSGEGIFSNRAPGSSNRYGLSFMTLYTNRMVINQFGQVGINKVNPQATLDVNGGFNVSGLSTLTNVNAATISATNLNVSAATNLGTLTVAGNTNINGTLQTKFLTVGDFGVRRAFEFDVAAADFKVGSDSQDGNVIVRHRDGTTGVELDGLNNRVKAGSYCDLGGNNCIVPGGATNGFGDWQTLSIGSTYTAATDGFVVLRINTAGDQDCWSRIETPVGTERQTKHANNDGVQSSMMSPVRKGDTWKANTGCSGTVNLYWLPVGS